MLNGRPMEQCLDATLKDVLSVMQDSTMHGTTYWGIATLKSPIDAWIYQEIVFETRPDVIVEIGNHHGGSLLMLAHWCDAMDHGKVIGVDLSHHAVPDQVREHGRITLIDGDACESLDQVKQHIAPGARVLVIEDSAHTFDNTLQVLRCYAPLVQPGDYFIVEDGICHHGLDVGPDPGPYEAIEAFLAENRDFESDRSRERFLVTWNPRGYLRRRTG